MSGAAAQSFEVVGIVSVYRLAVLMRPVVVDTGVELSRDVPSRQGSGNKLDLVGEHVVHLLVTATVLQMLDIVVVSGDVTVGIVFRVCRGKTTDNLLIETA